MSFALFAYDLMLSILWRHRQRPVQESYRSEFTAATEPILDVRSNSEFAAGSIPGSINIPVDVLQVHISEIAHDRIIITICGKGGGWSLEAAKHLRENGHPDTFYLCDGYLGWETEQKKEDGNLNFASIANFS